MVAPFTAAVLWTLSSLSHDTFAICIRCSESTWWSSPCLANIETSAHSKSCRGPLHTFFSNLASSPRTSICRFSARILWGSWPHTHLERGDLGGVTTGPHNQEIARVRRSRGLSTITWPKPHQGQVQGVSHATTGFVGLWSQGPPAGVSGLSIHSVILSANSKLTANYPELNLIFYRVSRYRRGCRSCKFLALRGSPKFC